ncbi:MAG: hypothetical protein M3464_12080 [Chloroflexota bacterium]|nr:hypothetical protein [Chloroflexota bacterium]
MAAFILADVAFLAGDAESTHPRLFIAHLVSLLALTLLPPRRNDPVTRDVRP